ncbi:CopM family metallochaperone [Teichococcus aestuarii]|uniref:DUF305 domain-containing protein n=1 Tax=Teichococcus aestuarii TaxID=568898 RepID=A0A2U1V9R6_9PROT|nr:DUF305 domain-containing protein [Pseudoroseomonas aestuarii]PWC30634.1 DUF305 domain-containing protein [Pseudoroseomonas aestuarii]
MPRLSLLLPALAALLAAGPILTAPALAQHAHQHGAAAAPAPAPADSPATAALKAANAKMHKDMDIPYSGDPDKDFARAMIPHHQGAIDMARVQLQYGKDPVLRRLAEEIIQEQGREIALLRTMVDPPRR